MKKTFINALFFSILLWNAILYSAENIQENPSETSNGISLIKHQIYDYMIKNEKLFNDYINKVLFSKHTSDTESNIQHYQDYFKKLHANEITFSDLNLLFSHILWIQYLSTSKIDNEASDIILKLLKTDNIYTVFYVGYLSEDFVDANLDEIIQAIKQIHNSDRSYLREIHFSSSAKEKYRDYFNQLVLDSKKEINGLEEKKDLYSYACRIDEYVFCAHFGDKETFNKVKELYNHSTDLDFYGYLRVLMEYNTKESLCVILSRFPDNKLVSYMDNSPRYRILCALYSKYPDDQFFSRYKDYLYSDNIFETFFQPSDSYIGNEDGVKKLFSELQVWAKERLNYDLSLENSIPRIKLDDPRHRRPLSF